jgi:hypothetical protein
MHSYLLQYSTYNASKQMDDEVQKPQFHQIWYLSPPVNTIRNQLLGAVP